jgi:hypothetical protein
VEEASFLHWHGRDETGRKRFGVNTVVANHFEMFVRNVNNKPLDEVFGRDSFCNQLVIFMSVVVESDGLTVIAVDTRRGNDRSAQISADILDNVFAFRNGRFGVDIEAVRTVLVDICFRFLERTADVFLHEVQQSSPERVAEQGIVEMFYMTPKG